MYTDLFLLCMPLYQLTYLRTPWCRVLPEQLTGLQLVKKVSAFHGTRRFITALTSVVLHSSDLKKEPPFLKSALYTLRQEWTRVTADFDGMQLHVLFRTRVYKTTASRRFRTSCDLLLFCSVSKGINCHSRFKKKKLGIDGRKLLKLILTFC